MTDLDDPRIKRSTNGTTNEGSELDGIRILSIPKTPANDNVHIVINNEDSLYVLVADGIRNGLSAPMSELHFPELFTDLANKGHSLLTIATKINDELYQLKSTYIALILVQINKVTGLIDALNCGIPTALLIDDRGEFIHTFESTSLACGVVENEHYELSINRTHYTRPTKLYIFTDGLRDALMKSGQCQSHTDYNNIYKTPPESCFDTIAAYVNNATNKVKNDDITLIEISLSSPQRKLSLPKNIKKRTTNLLSEQEADKLLTACRVLCIDPCSVSRQKIEQDLTGFVGQLYLSDTVEEAIQIYHKYNPNLIIIDLPFLLKHQAALSSILPEHDDGTPIIISCEPSNVIVAEQLFTLPITRYLRKPHITSELFTKVKDCITLPVQHEHWQYNYSVFHASSLAMSITDAKQRIIRVNDAFCRITGYRREELINCTPKLLSSGRQGGSFYQKMWQSINTTGHWSGEIWNKRKTGELFLEWITINSITDESGKAISYCSVFSDITEQKAVDEAIKKLSNYDDLTELPNRRLFKTTLQNSLDQVELAHQDDGLAVLFLDLDKFKDINDTLGHEYGDLVLKETAARLKNCIRENDLIARLGGDEFTICLYPNSKDAIEVVTKKILDEMAKRPFKIHLSVSIGVALYPHHGSDVSSLLKHADQAMFYAKDQGRNCVRVFTPSMETSALEKRAVIHDLHLAVQNEQFELLYQPILELKTNSLHKAEALIRWHHPEKGLISPDRFIPLAEETGLIIKIGDWVFEQAVSQSKLWRERIHSQFQISINKSPKQFGIDKSHHRQWINYLGLKQLSTDGIAVEITEGVLMDSKDVITEELLSFREKGIQVSLDDFGTGHSSLAYLRKFDIDYLKIDRQFVKHIESNTDDQALCKAIISMAHTLGLKVIAEGIETAWQKEFFVNANCDYGQGYFFSKPITAKQFEEYFHHSIENKPL